MLEAAKTCGPKTLAWGEFGLDYSHAFFGQLATNRQVMLISGMLLAYRSHARLCSLVHAYARIWGWTLTLMQWLARS